MRVGRIFLDAYIAVLLAALLLGPLIVLHSYRTWWLDIFCTMMAGGYIGGSIAHYSMVRRNKKS